MLAAATTLSHLGGLHLAAAVVDGSGSVSSYLTRHEGAEFKLVKESFPCQESDQVEMGLAWRTSCSSFASGQFSARKKRPREKTQLEIESNCIIVAERVNNQQSYYCSPLQHGVINTVHSTTLLISE